MTKITIKDCEILWRGHTELEMMTAVQECLDGRVITLKREVLKAPDSVAVLLYRKDNHHLVLTSQWRVPMVSCGVNQPMIEVCAGNIDEKDYAENPQDELQAACQAACREVEEETGWHVQHLHFLYALYTSPGISTERLYCFIGCVDQKNQSGGGVKSEGEDIEILEFSLVQAMHAIQENQIRDMKTVMLLQKFHEDREKYLGS